MHSVTAKNSAQLPVLLFPLLQPFLFALLAFALSPNVQLQLQRVYQPTQLVYHFVPKTDSTGSAASRQHVATCSNCSNAEALALLLVAFVPSRALHALSDLNVEVWRILDRGNPWKPSGNHLETIWKPSGNHLETIWKPSGNHLETIWERKQEKTWKKTHSGRRIQHDPLRFQRSRSRSISSCRRKSCAKLSWLSQMFLKRNMRAMCP